jgi:hypothetical protein
MHHLDIDVRGREGHRGAGDRDDALPSVAHDVVAGAKAWMTRAPFRHVSAPLRASRGRPASLVTRWVLVRFPRG